VFQERGELPKTAPMTLQRLQMDVEKMAQAGKERQMLLEQIEAERKAFATTGELPKKLLFELEKMRAAANAKMEVAYDLAMREYTIARKEEQARAVQDDLKKFEEEVKEPNSAAGPMLSLQHRFGAAKQRLLRSSGGNDETEAAVGRSLAWLAKRQDVDNGYWEFDGADKEDRVAATGMCLLPFLGAGETHLRGNKYTNTVRRGLDYLKAQIKANGQFGDAQMRSQAMATMALCEAVGMTRDSGLKAVASKAVDFIIEAQAANGSWGHTSGTAGDTTIVGWQIQALKSAKLAQIPVPPKCWEKASEFLESVSSDSGATYAYRAKNADRSATAPALLCRQFMGWTSRNPALLRGVEFLWTRYPPKEDSWDIDYYYYATQVVHFVDGPIWHRDWDPVMRALLLKMQITEKSVNARVEEFGSWPKDSRLAGERWGKLGTSALACLTLEVYYRHQPTYGRKAVPE
jgi:hypothetical protein